MEITVLKIVICGGKSSLKLSKIAYLMTYIDRPNKEKGTRKKEKKQHIYSLFDINELRHLIE